MDGVHPSSSPEVRRKRFSAADVQIMLRTGVIKHREKVELLGGELIEMSPQGPLHWNVTYGLSRWFRRNLPSEFGVASQGPLRLSDYSQPEPEFVVFSDQIEVNDVRGPDAILVIEVADSSVEFDLGAKAQVYAQHGGREYWVVDINKQRTVVHHLGADRAYRDPQVVLFDQPLSAPGGGSLIIADLAPKA